MEASEALLLDYYPALSQAWYCTHPEGLFSLRKAGATFTPFTATPQVLYVRPDNGEPAVTINVFDSLGHKVYTIERRSRYATLWTVYEASTRRQVAEIKCGLVLRSISFINKRNIKTRRIGQPRWRYGGLPDHRFYLDDGAPYEWTRNSQYLERVLNPGGGTEETRQRLARVRLLRARRFEYELLVDEDFDREIALGTAFIAMLTEWSTLHLVVPGVRST